MAAAFSNVTRCRCRLWRGRNPRAWRAANGRNGIWPEQRETLLAIEMQKLFA
jgi:hypothetical protein